MDGALADVPHLCMTEGLLSDMYTLQASLLPLHTHAPGAGHALAPAIAPFPSTSPALPARADSCDRSQDNS